MSSSEERKNVFVTRGGVELPLLPVSEVELVPVYQAFSKPPKPPVEVLPNGKQVEHKAHPDYLAALEVYNTRAGIYSMAVIIEYGVDLELSEEQQTQVEKRRKKKKRNEPNNLEAEFDTYLFVTMLCPTMDELKELNEAILRLNTPTEEQVRQHLATFRSSIPRSPIVGNNDTGVGDRVTNGAA